MPKLVDHASRREELVHAVWRILARDGAAAMTMRQVAAEAGYANGAIKPYFATKTDLVEATYTHVFEQTNRRVAGAVTGLRGLAAVEVFSREVMPLDDERLDEARVVLAFWQEAAHDATRAAHNRRFMAQWRDSLLAWLDEARVDGELTTPADPATWTDGFLTFLLGTQVTAALGLPAASPAHLERQLQAQLEPLRT